MKSILEFDLPEEQGEFDVIIKAGDMHSVLIRLDNMLRNMLKHGHSFKNVDEALDHVRQELWDDLNDRGINLHCLGN